MQVKDMSLKNERYLFNFFIICFILISYKAFSNADDKTKVLSYLYTLKKFSASFLQIDGENFSEGKIYIGEKRVRAEYLSPTKILIILDEEKAMYYDYELDEDEFFNPKNTNAWFFYDIFRNPLFFDDGTIIVNNNELILQKKGVDNEQKEFFIRVYFEKNPLILRGIEIVINEEVIKISIYNHNYNQDFDKKLFKLINPKFFD